MKASLAAGAAAKGGGEGKPGSRGGGETTIKPGSRGGGETTITLSATHLQLIALSRLLLQRSSAKLVLLDEPAGTSNCLLLPLIASNCL